MPDMERVSDEKIEELKRTIMDYPGPFELYKKALICLIDNSDGLSRNVCIIIHESKVGPRLGESHSHMYVRQHNPNSIESYLRSNDFVGGFECESVNHGSYPYNHGSHTCLYWSADNGPLFFPCEFIPFVESENG